MVVSFKTYMTAERAVILAGRTLEIHAEDREARTQKALAFDPQTPLPIGLNDDDKARLETLRSLLEQFPDAVLPVVTAYMPDFTDPHATPPPQMRDGLTEKDA